MEFKTIQDIMRNRLADDGVYAVNGKLLKELGWNYMVYAVVRKQIDDDREDKPE